MKNVYGSDMTEKTNEEKNIDDGVRLYLNQIKQIKLLSKEEEFLYGKMLKEGSREEKEMAKTKLIVSNLRLVCFYAKKYYTKEMSMTYMDIVQEGTIGLMIAADKFDYTKGRFSTYATSWIKQSILRAISKKSHLIKIPVMMTELDIKIRNAENELFIKDGEIPSVEEIAQKTNLTVSFIKSHRDMQQCLPLNKKISEDDEVTYEDFLTDSELNQPEKIAEMKDLKEVLDHACKTYLTEREQAVIKRRYHMNYTLLQCANEDGCTVERIRQLQKNAINKLKNAQAVKLFIDYKDIA